MNDYYEKLELTRLYENIRTTFILTICCIFIYIILSIIITVHNFTETKKCTNCGCQLIQEQQLQEQLYGVKIYLNHILF